MMKKLKIFIFVALFGAMTFGAFSAYEHYTMNEEERFLLANIEALTDPEDEIGGGAWFWEEDWDTCEFGGSITIHSSSGGFTAGTYIYSVSLIASLDSKKVSYSYIPPQPGRKSYCPSGWSPCSAKDCR